VLGARDWTVPSSHATWLAQRCRQTELWLRPDEGHVSVLNSGVMALDWLRGTPVTAEPEPARLGWPPDLAKRPFCANLRMSEPKLVDDGAHRFR